MYKWYVNTGCSLQGLDYCFYKHNALRGLTKELNHIEQQLLLHSLLKWRRLYVYCLMSPHCVALNFLKLLAHIPRIGKPLFTRGQIFDRHVAAKAVNFYIKRFINLSSLLLKYLKLYHRIRVNVITWLTKANLSIQINYSRLKDSPWG